METLHTKHPWHSCGDGNCSCGLVWGGEDDQKFVVAAAMDSCNEEYTGGQGVEPHSNEFFANMRLIAAAPELLESLQNLLGIFDSPQYRRKFSGLTTEAIKLAHKAVQKAIIGNTETNG